MNPLGAFLTCVFALIILGASRRVALLGMMAGVLFLTQVQAINVAGFNLFAVRLLELAGFVRVFTRHEFSFSKMNRTDHTLLLLYSFTTIVFCLRSADDKAYVIGQGWMRFCVISPSAA
jgi:hypothetical protein